MASVTTFGEIRARWGLARALYSAVMSRLRPWLVLCHISVRPLRTHLPPGARPDGIVTRVMTSDDLARAQLSAPAQFEPDFVAAAQARGDFCVGAFDGDRIVSFGWRTFSTAPADDGLWVGTPRPFPYGYKAFTDPAYRGRHLRDVVSLAGDQICLARDCTQMIGYRETHNFASIASSLRRGSVFVGYAGWFKLFGRVWAFHSPGVRRLGLRFYRPTRASTSPAPAPESREEPPRGRYVVADSRTRS
jgi:hypothetical protein